MLMSATWISEHGDTIYADFLPSRACRSGYNATRVSRQAEKFMKPLWLEHLRRSPDFYLNPGNY